MYYTGVADMRQSKLNIVGGETVVNVDLLKGKITERGTNVSEIAVKMGVDKATLYRRIADGSSFTIGEVEKITEALGLSHEEAISIFFSQSVA